MPKITDMYAYIAEDDGPEDEGVVAERILPDGPWMPLVGADKLRMISLQDIARRIARVSGKKITLVHFSNREDIEVIE